MFVNPKMGFYIFYLSFLGKYALLSYRKGEDSICQKKIWIIILTNALIFSHLKE